MDGEADTSGVLGDDGAVLEGVVDTGDGILLHSEEEARGHLGVRGTGVEEGGGGVGEVAAGHEVVRL